MVTQKALAAKLKALHAAHAKADARCKAHNKGGTSRQREARTEAYLAYRNCLTEGRERFGSSASWWELVSEVTNAR
jgi:hypothetical protein